MSHSHLLIALCALKVTGLPHNETILRLNWHHKQIGFHLVEEKKCLQLVKRWQHGELDLYINPPKKLHLKYVWILHCNLTLPIPEIPFPWVGWIVVSLDSAVEFSAFSSGPPKWLEHQHISEATYSSPTSFFSFFKAFLVEGFLDFGLPSWVESLLGMLSLPLWIAPETPHGG